MKESVYLTQLRHKTVLAEVHLVVIADEIGQWQSVSPSMESLRQNKGIV